MSRKFVIEVEIPESWFEEGEEFRPYPEITEDFISDLLMSRLGYGGAEEPKVQIQQKEG